ncbi:hypothetical protein R1flu_022081 [Riccia fluitans]|uniref:Uncharacterized protein n=1 Tax=Riccia fluitans TaxID=41844 RepID=A0ABD1ZR63_9MARC
MSVQYDGSIEKDPISLFHSSIVMDAHNLCILRTDPSFSILDGRMDLYLVAESLLHALHWHMLANLEGELVNLVRVLNKDLARLNQECERLDKHHDPCQFDIAGVGETVPSDLSTNHHMVEDFAGDKQLLPKIQVGL